jgi:S1-C subfamily serine protease
VRQLAMRVGEPNDQWTPSLSLDVTTLDRAPAPSAIAPTGITTPLSARPDLPIAGAELMSLNAGFAEALGTGRQGVLVLRVSPGTPAADAGLKAADVIVAVNGNRVTNPRTVMNVLYGKSMTAGDGDRSVVLDIIRERKSQKISLRW